MRWKVGSSSRCQTCEPEPNHGETRNRGTGVSERVLMRRLNGTCLSLARETVARRLRQKLALALMYKPGGEVGFHCKPLESLMDSH